MPDTAASRLESADRLEKKVDTLIDSVGELRSAQTRLNDQMVSDKRLTDQLIGFMQQAIDRLSNEVIGERVEFRAALELEKKERNEAIEVEAKTREKDYNSLKGTLSKIGFALFTAFLGLVCSGLAFVLLKP